MLKPQYFLSGLIVVLDLKQICNEMIIWTDVF